MIREETQKPGLATRPGFSRLLNSSILIVASLIGLSSFLFPFFTPQQDSSFGKLAHTQDAPLIFALLVVLCLAAALSSLSSGIMNSKLIAVLGVLTAANAVLRGVPGPAGFTLVLLLPILCGYAYGPTFGFLLGVFSLGVSAFIGFGVGPWLPYQMFAAGWVGLLSGWLPRLARHPRAETAMLAVWGLLWGFAFGALMNIWFWPYLAPPGGSELYWQPGVGPGRDAEAVRCFLRRHLAVVGRHAGRRQPGPALAVRRTGPAPAAAIPTAVLFPGRRKLKVPALGPASFAEAGR